MNKNTSDNIFKLALDLNRKKEDLEMLYNRISNDFKTKNPDIDEKTLEEKTFKRLETGTRKIPTFATKGEIFEGLLFASPPVFDIVARMREKATSTFKENPVEAVSSGLTDDDGKPLDTREKNENFGKVLPKHKHVRNVFGAAAKQGEDKPEYFSMGLWDEKALINIPLFKAVKFIGIDKGSDSGILKLNPSMNTSFEVEDKEIDVSAVLKNTIGFTKISELENWHEKHGNNRDKMSAIECDVVSIGPLIEKTKNRIVYIDNLDSDVAEPILCWTPEEMINFGIGSSIIIIGTTGLLDKKTPEGEVLPEKDICINVMGVYVKNNTTPEVIEDVGEGDFI